MRARTTRNYDIHTSGLCIIHLFMVHVHYHNVILLYNQNQKYIIIIFYKKIECVRIYFFKKSKVYNKSRKIFRFL